MTWKGWRAIAAATILALALPASALAVTSSGSTPETLIVDVTISLSAPASASYTKNGAQYDTGNLSISNLTTNNLTGMRVDLTTSAFTGPATVATTTRSRSLQTAPSGVGWSATPNSARSPGFYATSATTDWLSNRTTPTATPGAHDIVMHTESANFTTPGTYSGTLSLIASTNP